MNNVFNDFETSTKNTNSFLKNSYLISKVSHTDTLNIIRKQVIKIVMSFLGIKDVKDENNFLNNIHKVIKKNDVNNLRLHVYNEINKIDWFRPSYFNLGKDKIFELVGNELAMQSKINVSIQMPNDESSVLSMHADQYGGESHYQVVMWLPLVDVFDTKSMYIIPKKISEKIEKDINKYSKKGFTDKIYKEYKKKLRFLNINYGEVLIFSPNLFHGNITNKTNTTRWSFNTRIKSLFSPYVSEEKDLGNFYQPIVIRPVTSNALNYKYPEFK